MAGLDGIENKIHRRAVDIYELGPEELASFLHLSLDDALDNLEADNEFVKSDVFTEI